MFGPVKEAQEKSSTIINHSLGGGGSVQTERRGGRGGRRRGRLRPASGPRRRPGRGPRPPRGSPGTAAPPPTAAALSPAAAPSPARRPPERGRRTATQGGGEGAWKGGRGGGMIGGIRWVDRFAPASAQPPARVRVEPIPTPAPLPQAAPAAATAEGPESALMRMQAGEHGTTDFQWLVNLVGKQAREPPPLPRSLPDPRRRFALPPPPTGGGGGRKLCDGFVRRARDSQRGFPIGVSGAHRWAAGAIGEGQHGAPVVLQVPPQAVQQTLGGGAARETATSG